MYRSNEQKLADIMLGEAVLKLLNGDGAISFSSLMETLTGLAEVEEDVSRHQACLRAINGLRSSTLPADVAGVNTMATVTPLFAMQSSDR